jgi:uncharacterized membrane protein
MDRPSGTRIRLWWERASWVLPLLGLVAGSLLVVLVGSVDEALESIPGLETADTAMSPEAATAVLAAVGGGMITFSGFVFSFAILIVQFGSSAYSPRMVSYFLRRRVTQWILALFLATIAYCFQGLVTIGSEGRAQFVPRITVSVALLLLVFSLVGFIVLMHAAGSQIRVDFVLANIGRHSRAQLARRLPRQDPTLGVAPDPDGTPDARDLAPIDYSGHNGQIVAIDTRRLARIAHRRAITLVLELRVGDAITGGTPIARTDAADVPGLTRAISRCLVVDDERSLVHDPLYDLRLLVDIASRALSPAVNDPTTAVRALDEIEGVLRSAADRRLGTLRLDLKPGLLEVSTATWEEVVDLALLEIAECGVGQVQVTRRLVALLDDLIPDVPQDRQVALRRHRESLEAAVARQELSGRAAEVALRGDRQGLGGSG